jgi:hypothetical protein
VKGHIMSRIVISFALSLAMFGCSGDDPAPTVDAGMIVPITPTWHDDVAPIIAEHCQRCHEEDGIAPFPLLNYTQAKPMAAMIASSTAARRMPPFLADNSGDCHTWRDANWLSDDKLYTLAQWHATGAQEGEEKPAPEAPALPTIENPELSIQMPEPFLPDANLGDEYRCFVLDPELDRDRFVTAYEVVPGDNRVVHHVILYTPKDAEAENSALAMSGEGGRAGYTCYGGAKVPADMVVAWAPGTGATSFPATTGIALSAGRMVIMQIHYNMVSGSFEDQTTIKLALQDQVAKPGIMTLVGDKDLNIPAGLEAHVETADFPMAFARQPIQVWGILPHMHELGSKYRLERISGDQKECLIDVPRWDFNWQLGYFFEEPIVLQPTDSLRTTCTFDSRGRTEVTRFGEDTTDEMCLGLVFATLAN